MYDVVIVGAGVAGLVCALECGKQGMSVCLLEADSTVGGRIRSVREDGFILDLGFQVLLTAYPEAQRYLDYESLDLKKFEPGALVRFEGKFHHVADPRRVLSAAIESTLAPIGTLADKLRVVRLAAEMRRKSLDEIRSSPEKSTLDYLREQGFSEEIIERFFRPFLGGIYLERELITTSRKFEFVFKMFAEGYAVVPALGMQAIPEQLASRLAAGTIRFESQVKKVSRDRVWLQDGEEIRAQAVVLSTDIAASHELLGLRHTPATVSTVCMYFATERPPVEKPILVLNGDGNGPVNHVVVMSNVSPSFAPKGKSLVSVNIVGLPQEPDLGSLVVEQMSGWFGSQVREWRLLRTFVVANALPLTYGDDAAPETNGIILAGDYLENASTNGAMRSGRLAAEAVIEKLGVTTQS